MENKKEEGILHVLTHLNFVVFGELHLFDRFGEGLVGQTWVFTPCLNPLKL